MLELSCADQILDLVASHRIFVHTAVLGLFKCEATFLLYPSERHAS